MRKQARRLWLGDWQRGDEDTVVLLPVDEDDPEPPRTRRRSIERWIAGLAAVAVLFALGYAASSGGNNKHVADTEPQTAPAQPQPQPQLPQVPQGGGQGFGGADLTGSGAAKAAKAAVAQFPGDVERVTAGPTGGGYVVHVIQPDGNEVHVVVSDEFKVLGSDAGRGGVPQPAPNGGSTNSS